MIEEPMERTFPRGGRVYVIPEMLLNKFVGEDTRRKRIWVFGISNPAGTRGAYSGVFKTVSGRSLEKDERQIFYDTEFFFGLALDNALVACIGFTDRPNTTHRTDRITVQQIQGKRYREEELKGLRWEKLLLSIVCDWAFTHRYTEVRVRPKSLVTAKKMLYKVTPKRLGFVQESTDEDTYFITWDMWQAWCERNLQERKSGE